MKISDVIQEIRKRLGDFDRIEYSLTVQKLLTNIRLNLDDSVEPFRWETERLNEYIDSAYDTIRFRRKDVKTSNPGSRFELAVIAYATARAFEHEAEDQSDASRCQFYWKKFEEELFAIPIHRSDAELIGYINPCIREIFRLRPDLRLDKNGFPVKRPTDAATAEDEFILPDTLLPAVAAYSAARCIDEDKGDKDRIVLYSKEFNQLVRGEA